MRRRREGDTLFWSRSAFFKQRAFFTRQYALMDQILAHMNAARDRRFGASSDGAFGGEGLGMKFSRVLAMLAGLVAVVPGAAAYAQSAAFSYTGSGDVFAPDILASGSGAFTTDGLGDLTSFSFNLVLSSQSLGGTDDYTYGLGDVESFNAVFTNGVLTGLSFMTDQQPGYYFPNEFFWVQDLGVGDASSGDWDVGAISTGTVTVDSQVPEPAALVVFTSGLLGLGALRRRRNANLAVTGV
jgi:hypothetical protein